MTANCSRPGNPQALLGPVRPKSSRSHHSWNPPNSFLHQCHPETVIVLQEVHRHEMVDATVWKQVEDEGRQSPVRFLEPPY
jgi:hypothetical protein